MIRELVIVMICMTTGCTTAPLSMSERLNRPLQGPVFYDDCEAVQKACPRYNSARWCSDNVSCGFFVASQSQFHVPRPTSGQLRTELIGHETLHWILGPTWPGHGE